MLSVQGLQQRATLLQAVRTFFIDRGYIEVDTPIRLPVLLPEANILPIASDNWFLQPSPELCMKRLLARGCAQLFQICHCFRAGESGRLHHPEFTMLEWYHAGWDYIDLMGECEQLIHGLCVSSAGLSGLLPDGSIQRGDCLVDTTPPWPRLTVAEAFRQYAGAEVLEVLARGCFDEVLVTEVEPQLGRESPVFLYDYPVALGSLARCRRDNPQVAERFELYIAGVELANGFSELVDAREQRQRFSAEIATMRTSGRMASMPELFLADLTRMHETAGIALGLDRLLMLLCGREQLADILPFIYEEL